MRVLIANHSHAVGGGAESYLRRLLEHAGESDLEFSLLVESPEAARGPFIICDESMRVWHWGVRDEGETRAAITAWGPEIVYVNGLNDTILEEWLVNTFPSVLYAHNYYGTCLTGEKRHRFPKLVMCERTFGVSCFGYCYLRGCGSLRPSRLLESYLHQKKRNGLLGSYRSILVASKWMRAEFERHEVGHVEIVPLFVDPEPRAPKRSGPVLFLGRLTEVKGAALLIEAFALLDSKIRADLSLVIVGDGLDRSRLVRLSHDLRVPAEFTGWLGLERLHETIAGASVVALPSMWPEPFGLSGLEAAAMGKPIVAFPTGGIVDWLEPGVVGEMPPPGDFSAEGIARSLTRVLADPDYYERLSIGAHAAAARFGAARHLDSLKDAFAAVLGAVRR